MKIGVNLIAAIGQNNELGKDNQLLTRSLPNDLIYFKNKTWGLPVIMGRKTFDSLNNIPLSGRQNVVISSQKLVSKNQSLYFVNNMNDSLNLVSKFNVKDLFIIGGASIYKLFLPLAHRLYMTKIESTFNADVYFPDIDYSLWQLESKIKNFKDDKNLFNYNFEVWRKKSEGK